MDGLANLFKFYIKNDLSFCSMGMLSVQPVTPLIYRAHLGRKVITRTSITFYDFILEALIYKTHQQDLLTMIGFSVFLIERGS